MKKESIEKNLHTKSFLRFDLLIALLCGLLILACFISSFFPKSRFWGINHLAYFPLWIRIVFALSGLAILIPWINSKVYNLLDQALSIFQKIFIKKKVLSYFFLSLVFIFVFWLLRTRTYFLGDSYSMILQLDSEKYMRAGFEILEHFVHLYGFKFLKLFLPITGKSVYIIISVLAGGVFILILTLLTKLFSEDRMDRIFIFSIFLFSGATELFLGYAENYTLTYVGIFAYLYFSLRYLQGKTKIYLPIIFCVLSIGFHFSSAYLLPSLFFLFILKKKKGELVFSLKRSIPYLLILIFLFIIFVYYIRSINPLLTEIFVPVLKGRIEAPEYTLLSLNHLLDILNQHLLLSPAGVILFLSLALIYKKRIKFKDPIIGFLMIVTAAQLSYHLLVDPELGAGKDWDLFSIVGLGYLLLVCYLLISLVQSRRYSSITLLFTSFICISPWFLTNANTERSIQRFKNLLDLDLKRSLGGRQILILYYTQQKMFFEVEQIKNEIYDIFPEDSLNRMATNHNKRGEYDKAIKLLREAIELNPNFIPAYSELGRAYLYQNRIDEAIDVLQKVVLLKPYNAAGHMNLGGALLEKGKLKEALTEFKKVEKIGGEGAAVYSGIAYVHFKLKEDDKAVKAYKKALKIDPGFSEAHYGLGLIYLDRNLIEQAIDEFNQLAKLKPDFAHTYYLLGTIYSRKGFKEKAIENYELFLKYNKDEVQNEKVKELIQQLRPQGP